MPVGCDTQTAEPAGLATTGAVTPSNGVRGENRPGGRVPPLDDAVAAAVGLPDEQDGAGGICGQVGGGGARQGDRGSDPGSWE